MFGQGFVGFIPKTCMHFRKKKLKSTAQNSKVSLFFIYFLLSSKASLVQIVDSSSWNETALTQKTSLTSFKDDMGDNCGSKNQLVFGLVCNLAILLSAYSFCYSRLVGQTHPRPNAT